MLYRAEAEDGLTGRIGIAQSKDEFHSTPHPEPVLSPVEVIAGIRTQIRNCKPLRCRRIYKTQRPMASYYGAADRPVCMAIYKEEE